MRSTFPSLTCKSNIRPTSAASSAHQDERTRSAACVPRAQRPHNRDWIDVSLVSQRAIRSSARHQTLKGVGRAQFVLGEWKIAEPGLTANLTQPLGQDQRPVKGTATSNSSYFSSRPLLPRPK
ncbi:hypothetical protein Q3C01_44505 [Bradyrhizobium sp. UFLA05-109]